MKVIEFRKSGANLPKRLDTPSGFSPWKSLCPCSSELFLSETRFLKVRPLVQKGLMPITPQQVVFEALATDMMGDLCELSARNCSPSIRIPRIDGFFINGGKYGIYMEKLPMHTMFEKDKMQDIRNADDALALLSHACDLVLDLAFFKEVKRVNGIAHNDYHAKHVFFDNLLLTSLIDFEYALMHPLMDKRAMDDSEFSSKLGSEDGTLFKEIIYSLKDILSRFFPESEASLMVDMQNLPGIYRTCFGVRPEFPSASLDFLRNSAEKFGIDLKDASQASNSDFRFTPDPFEKQAI